MHRLQRTVRLVINPPNADRTKGHGHAGSPTPAGLPRFYEVDVVCRGTPDAESGYLIDIKKIDSAVRTSFAPVLEASAEPVTLAGVIVSAKPGVAALADALPVPLASVRLHLTPHHSIEFHTESSMSNTAVLRQVFEFAASHRLHVTGLSDEENRNLFGKCNNPNGHGHNYRVQPEIVVDLTDADADRPGFHDIEKIVDDAVLEPFDHTHLNEDTEDFGPNGVNPSVENIAQVCHTRIARELAARFPRARLASVTVWETERTSATYPA